MKSSHEVKIARVIDSCKTSDHLNCAEAWVKSIVKDGDKLDWYVFKIGGLRISLLKLPDLTKIELYGFHAQNYMFQELLKFRF